ncbi:MAG: 2-amino-4-hydroxy-6-hydroxymethyldihydropteridine diphosphokinase [Nitrospiraceae bacterium]|jgi:2-amino-4-hydroxy-6-hydroxymethyldihydropteridine diphosphokinase|nr:MAG: 2-amino-4-hydroxy-6-hydroxymethyldihydropteridine diphosphokinase [Nitrospiraceae bacterium]
MATVFLGIGSNIGDRQKQCEKALELLQEYGLRIAARSSLYRTEPWGKKEQPWFFNMAIEGTTDYSPHALLDLIKKIEDELGRQESVRWGPRSIDIDILLYDDIILNGHELVIPHPLMHEREFVLRPLSEIAPDKTHPVLTKPVKDLLQEVLHRKPGI